MIRLCQIYVVSTKIISMAGAAFVMFLLIVGGVVWFFTRDDGSVKTTKDYEVETTVYGFDEAAVVDITVKNMIGKGLQFRSCTLNVPEEITVYTDHTLFTGETKLIAVVGKPPSINYEYTLKCTYIKDGHDYDDKRTLYGAIVIPKPLILTLEKTENKILGKLEGSTLYPRVFATIGASDLRELKVAKDEDFYTFSLSGDTTQRATVVALGGIEEALFYTG